MSLWGQKGGGQPSTFSQGASPELQQKGAKLYSGPAGLGQAGPTGGDHTLALLTAQCPPHTQRALKGFYRLKQIKTSSGGKEVRSRAEMTRAQVQTWETEDGGTPTPVFRTRPCILSLGSGSRACP